MEKSSIKILVFGDNYKFVYTDESGRMTDIILGPQELIDFVKMVSSMPLGSLLTRERKEVTM